MARLTSGLTEMFGRLTEFARFKLDTIQVFGYQEIIFLDPSNGVEIESKLHKVARRSPVRDGSLWKSLGYRDGERQRVPFKGLYLYLSLLSI